MRKQNIQDAAFEVATQVRAVEDNIDATLAELAELQARILRVNAVARTSVGTVHGVLEQLAAAFNGLVETRGSIVACHAELVQAKQLVPGLRTVSFGEGNECPEPTGNLRIVA